MAIKQNLIIKILRILKCFSLYPAIGAIDFLKNEVAIRMLENLQAIKLKPLRILDFGCTSRNDLSVLGKQYKKAHLIEVDCVPYLSKAINKKSKSKFFITKVLAHFGFFSHKSLIVANIEHLPIRSEIIDLIWANLALFCNFNERILSSLADILSKQGLLMLSTFGPSSLKELRVALNAIDDKQHMSQLIVQFMDMHDIGDLLVQNGFENPVIDAEFLTISYKNPESLLADVVAFGVCPEFNAKINLSNSAWKQKLCLALNAGRAADGLLRITIELVYAHAWKKSFLKQKNKDLDLTYIRPNEIKVSHMSKRI